MSATSSSKLPSTSWTTTSWSATLGCTTTAVVAWVAVVSPLDVCTNDIPAVRANGWVSVKANTTRSTTARGEGALFKPLISHGTKAQHVLMEYAVAVVPS